LQAHGLLALLTVDRLLPRALLVLLCPEARLFFFSFATFGGLDGGALLLFSALPGRFLVGDAVFLDLAQLAQGKED
jgi:hypothetical protein